MSLESLDEKIIIREIFDKKVIKKSSLNFFVGDHF